MVQSHEDFLPPFYGDFLGVLSDVSWSRECFIRIFAFSNTTTDPSFPFKICPPFISLFF